MLPDQHCLLSVAGDGTLAVIDLRRHKVGWEWEWGCMDGCDGGEPSRACQAHTSSH